MWESNPPGNKNALVLFLLLQYCEGPCCNGSTVCADKNEHKARLQQITVNAFRLGNFKPSSRWVLATSLHPSLAGVAWQTVSAADTAPDVPATEIPHLLSYFFRVEILALLMGPLRFYMPSCSFHRAPGWNPVRQMRVQQTYPQQKNLPDWGTASSEHKKPSAGETEAPGHRGQGWTWWHQPAPVPHQAVLDPSKVWLEERRDVSLLPSHSHTAEESQPRLGLSGFSLGERCGICFYCCLALEVFLMRNVNKICESKAQIIQIINKLGKCQGIPSVVSPCCSGIVFKIYMWSIGFLKIFISIFALQKQIH